MNTRPWLLEAIVGLMVTMAPLAAGEPIKMHLPQHETAAPANVVIQVSVEPNAENHSLEVIVDSGAYYRCSEVALDGVDARRVHAFEFRNVPSGTYEIRAVLRGAGGKPRASADSAVIVH